MSNELESHPIKDALSSISIVLTACSSSSLPPPLLSVSPLPSPSIPSTYPTHPPTHPLTHSLTHSLTNSILQSLFHSYFSTQTGTGSLHALSPVVESLARWQRQPYATYLLRPSPGNTESLGFPTHLARTPLRLLPLPRTPLTPALSSPHSFPPWFYLLCLSVSHRKSDSIAASICTGNSHYLPDHPGPPFLSPPLPPSRLQHFLRLHSPPLTRIAPILAICMRRHTTLAYILNQLA